MEEIDLKEIFNMFWSRKIVIFLIVMVFILIGIVYTKFMVKPDYKSTATLVLAKNTADNTDTITQTEVTLNQKLVATYTELIQSKSVLRQVITNLKSDINEEALKNSVSVKLVSKTQLIEISVTNEDPEVAKDFAREITNVFIDRVKEIYKIDNINVVDEAKVDRTPYNIHHTKDIMIFAFIGIVVSGGYVLIASMLDTTIKTAEEAESRLGLNVLASIPNYDYENKRKGNKR